MKRQIYTYISIFCFIILFFKTVQAEIPIWQIGDPNNDSFAEFVFPDTNIIEYTVPQNWESLSDPNDPNYGNWGKFPKFLYPFGEHENIPQEIKINFDYLEDYSFTTLKIKATTQSSDPNIRLKIFKGEIFIGEKHIEKPIIFDDYVFPMGFVKKGLYVENKIIIKSDGPFKMPIYFDYISLVSNDSDGDGVSDIDEGDCSLDKATTYIPIKTSDPDSSIIKIIKLHINIDELEGAIPGFREVRFLDPNTLNLPEWLRSSRLFPYGFLGFKVEEFKPHDKIAIQISIMDQKHDQPDKLYPSVRFHVYQDSNTWHETDFELHDENTTARILLYDNGEGDFDGKGDGIINTKLAISYPRTIDVNVEKRGCFINAVIRGRDHGKDL